MFLQIVNRITEKSLKWIFFQIIIKDTTIILTPAHIKAYMIQTLKGLEYLHRHWILHRV